MALLSVEMAMPLIFAGLPTPNVDARLVIHYAKENYVAFVTVAIGNFGVYSNFFESVLK